MARMDKFPNIDYMPFQPGESCYSYQIIIHGFIFIYSIRNSRIAKYINEIVCPVTPFALKNFDAE